MSKTDNKTSERTSRLDWLIDLFEKKFFFWLITGSVAIGSTWFTNYLHKDEIDRAASQLKAKGEYETAVGLVNQLSNRKESLTIGDREIYINLLDHLAESGFNGKLKEKLKNYAEKASKEITKQATPEPSTLVAEQSQANLTTPLGKPPVAVLQEKPMRLYVQYGNEDQRQLLQKIRTYFASSKTVSIPPAEFISKDKKLPKVSNLRYCPLSTSSELASEMHQQLQVFVSELKLYPLREELCGAVRPNHLELWLSQTVR